MESLLGASLPSNSCYILGSIVKQEFISLGDWTKDVQSLREQGFAIINPSCNKDRKSENRGTRELELVTAHCPRKVADWAQLSSNYQCCGEKKQLISAIPFILTPPTLLCKWTEHTQNSSSLRAAGLAFSQRQQSSNSGNLRSCRSHEWWHSSTWMQ